MVSCHVGETWARRLTAGEEMNGACSECTPCRWSPEQVLMDRRLGVAGRRRERYRGPPSAQPGSLGYRDPADIQFIPLTATFQPTIIGIPLSALSDSPCPILSLSSEDRRRFSPRAELGPRSSLDPYAGGSAGGAHKPVKEVWRCLEYLMEHAGAEDLWMPSEKYGMEEQILAVIQASRHVWTELMAVPRYWQ